ncbi:MAG TPA: response regulator transcription factor [Microbacteriaceae bacterium]
MQRSPITVAIVDDHEAVRYGFAGACEEFGYTLVASAATVPELLEKLGRSRVDVVVMDLSLADGSLIRENVKAVTQRKMPVLIFSIADKPNLTRAAIKNGAHAIVPKSETMQDLMKSIELTSRGVFINNSETTAAIDSDQDFKAAQLTEREREVLTLYASGLALKQVAYQLGVERSTAKEHIDRVRRKYSRLGRYAGTKIDLLRRAIEDGFINEELL